MRMNTLHFNDINESHKHDKQKKEFQKNMYCMITLI